MKNIIEKVFSFLKNKLIVVALLGVSTVLFLLYQILLWGDADFTISSFIQTIAVLVCMGFATFAAHKGEKSICRVLCAIGFGVLVLPDAFTCLTTLDHISDLGDAFDLNVSLGLLYLFTGLFSLSAVALLAVLVLKIAKIQLPVLDLLFVVFLGVVLLSLFMIFISTIGFLERFEFNYLVAILYKMCGVIALAGAIYTLE